MSSGAETQRRVRPEKQTKLFFKGCTAMNRYVTSFCAALLVLAAVSAWATTYPAYTCT